MAIVTGTLNDFGLKSLAPYSPEIVFTPSGPAVTGAQLLATRPVVVTPSATGAFTVDLAPTDALRPARWYELSIRWLDPNSFGPDQGYIGVDFADWKLYVPTGGGSLADLLSIPANPAQVWVSESEPDNPTEGTWWLNPITGDLKEWN